MEKLKARNDKLEHRCRVAEENEKSSETTVSKLRYQVTANDEVNSRARAETESAVRAARQDREVAETRHHEIENLTKKLRSFENGVANKVHELEKHNRALVREAKTDKATIQRLESQVTENTECLGQVNIDMLARKKVTDDVCTKLATSESENAKIKLQLKTSNTEHSTTKTHYKKAVALSNKLMKEVKMERENVQSLEMKCREAEGRGKKEAKAEIAEKHLTEVTTLTEIVENKTKQNEILKKKLRQKSQQVIDLEGLNKSNSSNDSGVPSAGDSEKTECTKAACMKRLSEANLATAVAQKAITDFMDDKIREEDEQKRERKRAEDQYFDKLLKANKENQSLKTDLANKEVAWAAENKAQGKANDLQITALKSQLELETLKNSVPEEEIKKPGPRLSKRARRNAEKMVKEAEKVSGDSQEKMEITIPTESPAKAKSGEISTDGLSPTPAGLSLSDLSFNLSSDLSVNLSANDSRTIEPPPKKQRRETKDDTGKAKVGQDEGAKK